MSKRVAKMASAAIPHREQTPIMVWLRNKLLASVNRSGAAGLPGPDGKSEHKNPVRFPSTQAARAMEMPNLPGGVHHRLSDVYYYDRDGRRTVSPPKELYRADAEGQKFIGTETEEKQVSKGPAENFGLAAPTPGTGFEWHRDNRFEAVTQKSDKILKAVEKYDRYLRP